MQRSRREHTLRLEWQQLRAARRMRSICYLFAGVGGQLHTANAGSRIVLVNPGSARAAGRRGHAALSAQPVAAVPEMVGCRLPAGSACTRCRTPAERDFGRLFVPGQAHGAVRHRCSGEPSAYPAGDDAGCHAREQDYPARCTCC
ncbi:MAG: hypothetical protein ACLVJH_12820 [Faecalibacterium prausnitzii]